MQPAGVRRALVARIGDLDRHPERIVAEAVFEREREGERIDGAGPLVVAKREPDEIRPGGLDGEGLEPGEAVQAEGVSPAVDPGAVAGPADDGIEDRADLGPDRRIARPQKLAPADRPAARLGAGQRNRRARRPVGELDRGHSTIPSSSTAEISASFTPGAQAMSGLPLVSPSPARKLLT